MCAVKFVMQIVIVPNIRRFCSLPYFVAGAISCTQSVLYHIKMVEQSLSCQLVVLQSSIVCELFFYLIYFCFCSEIKKYNFGLNNPLNYSTLTWKTLPVYLHRIIPFTKRNSIGFLNFQEQRKKFLKKINTSWSLMLDGPIDFVYVFFLCSRALGRHSFVWTKFFVANSLYPWKSKYLDHW